MIHWIISAVVAICLVAAVVSEVSCEYLTSVGKVAELSEKVEEK